MLRPIFLHSLAAVLVSLHHPAVAAAPLHPQLPAPPRHTDSVLQNQAWQPRFQAPLRRPPARGGAPVPELTDTDLQENVALASHILNQAMLREDWGTLRRIMRFYPDMSGIDVVLRDYVLGALYRHERRYPQAIALYRQLVDQNPDLYYIRLELGVMLMEDNAWREADREFAVAQRRLHDPAAQHDVALYRRMLQREQQWQFQAGLGLARNTNINSANKDRFLRLPVAGPQGATVWVPFAKSPDALPQAAWGVKYSGSAQREQNLAGHHFYTLAAEGEGVSYRRHQAYSDQSITLRAGYRHQNINTWLAITPQAGKAWVGGKPYSHSHGLALEAGYRPDAPWQFVGSFLWLARHYDDRHYAAYDGRSATWALTAVRGVSPRLLAYGRVGIQQEALRQGEYSSRFPWLEVGAAHTLGHVLAARVNVRYGHRRYQQPYALFLHAHRRDRELGLSATLWKPGLTLHGLQPQLFLSHMRNRSNLAMYGRSKTEVALMLEKRI